MLVGFMWNPKFVPQLQAVDLVCWKISTIWIIVSDIALQVATRRVINIVRNVVDSFYIFGDSCYKTVEGDEDARYAR